MYGDSSSRRNSVRTQVKTLTAKSRIAVDITLNDNQQGAYVSSYTTLDKIEGEVSITAPCDTSFDDISITFDGKSYYPYILFLLFRERHTSGPYWIQEADNE